MWTAKVEENRNGYYMTLAPLVAGGKVMVGASGGERRVRGFVAAYDPETGKEAWRAYTVPGVDARSMQARLNTVSPGNFPEVPEGGVVWVFAVK
jgi:outer membrane protein assembly factor BamB